MAHYFRNSINILKKTRQAYVLYDVTELSTTDQKTGVQRVVRSILQEWVAHPREKFIIQPVRAIRGRYYYAHEFFQDFLGYDVKYAEKGQVCFQDGDIFLSIDFNYEAAFACRDGYQEMRKNGVKVIFVVHDLLCLQMPEYFFDFASEKHHRWLKIVAENDAAICVSHTVANELSLWVKRYIPQRQVDFKITWFHLGSDIENSLPTLGLPENINDVLAKLAQSPSFLMVGTIEPRKGHQQVLDSFDLLWKKNTAANLIIVGKAGWHVKKLLNTLREHTELGHRLFWLEGISDECLDKIYQNSDCLIAASEGEGFGLPLIEAARHGLPIIARDIPVFHEVTQNHAYFFSGKSPNILAEDILLWLDLFKKTQHICSRKIPWLTWQQSADQLWSRILTL